MPKSMTPDTATRIQTAHQAFLDAVENQSGIAEAWVSWQVERELALTERDTQLKAANAAAHAAWKARDDEWRAIGQEIRRLNGTSGIIPNHAELVAACLKRISDYTGQPATALGMPPGPGNPPRSGARGIERAPLSFEADLVAATNALITKRTA